MDLVLAVLVARFINALIWTPLLWKIVHNGPITGVTRALLTVVLFVGFWVFVLAGLATAGFVDAVFVRYVLTAYIAATAIVGITLLSMRGKI